MSIGSSAMNSDQHLTAATTIHATAVLIGARAVLIQGPAGAGKSRLALALLSAAQTGQLAFARLVADDRALIEPAHERLLVRPAPALAGLLEVRGLGIRRVPYEPLAVVGIVVELAAGNADRMPEPASRETLIGQIRLPRLAVAPGVEPLPLLLAALQTAEAVA